MKWPRSAVSALSAVVLALITLTTFYVFQDYGPQSAIRRFHQDVATGNLADLDQVTLNPRSPAAGAMASFVYSIFRGGSTYEIVAVKRSAQNSVQVVVQYVDPRGFGRVRTWIVRQQEGQWKVDCWATTVFNQR